LRSAQNVLRINEKVRRVVRLADGFTRSAFESWREPCCL